MKKICLLSAVALMALASCDDYDDQFNLGNQISDVRKDTPIVLTAEDYATVANLADNKELAAKLDAESGTTAYTEALAKLGTQKYFGTLITADQFLPAFINNKYKEADLGSTFRVTYNEYTGTSEYLTDFDKLKGEYTFTADDYSEAWGGASSAKYLTPATVGKLPALLKDIYDEAEAGDMYVVNYAFSDFEPAGGGSDTPTESYDKISDVTANTAGGEYTVKGIVCATYSRGFLLTDNTGYILVYKTSEVNIGDEVTVAGTTSAYGGLMQFPNSSEVTMVKEGKVADYKHPTPKVLVGADFDAYCAAPYVAYVTYEGTLSISGNYYNVTVDGTEKVGSLANVPAGMVDASLDGKKVVVTGYAIGATGSGGKYLNVMLTNIVEATAAASAHRVARRAATNGGVNTSVVYRFDGSAWKAYTAGDAKVVVAQPEWYDLIGSTTVSKPDTYFPKLLASAMPFAEEGQKAAVVYRKSASQMAVAEYTYNAATGWEASKAYKAETTTFTKTEAGFEAQISMYLNETLLGSEGGFVAYNVNLNTLSYVWQNTTTYGWKASGYANKTNVAAESWLVSPAINLKKGKNPQMVFDEAMNFLGSNNIEDFLSVKVSTNFDGSDVNAATWETLNITGRSDGASWTFYTIDPVSLANYVGNTIHIAFVYKSTDAVAPTYELKNIVVKEADAE